MENDSSESIRYQIFIEKGYSDKEARRLANIRTQKKAKPTFFHGPDAYQTSDHIFDRVYSRSGNNNPSSGKRVFIVEYETESDTSSSNEEKDDELGDFISADSIHYVWVGNTEPPEEHVRNIRWQALNNTERSFILWRDGDSSLPQNLADVENVYYKNIEELRNDGNLDTFEIIDAELNYGHPAFAYNALKMLILDKYGGYCLDIDARLSKTAKQNQMPRVEERHENRIVWGKNLGIMYAPAYSFNDHLALLYRGYKDKYTRRILKDFEKNPEELSIEDFVKAREQNKDQLKSRQSLGLLYRGSDYALLSDSIYTKSFDQQLIENTDNNLQEFLDLGSNNKSDGSWY